MTFEKTKLVNPMLYPNNMFLIQIFILRYVLLLQKKRQEEKEKETRCNQALLLKYYYVKIKVRLNDMEGLVFCFSKTPKALAGARNGVTRPQGGEAPYALNKKQKFDNSVIKTSYNAADNSETVRYQDGSMRVIQKDVLGNVIQVAGASGMLYYHYDSSGRLLTAIDAQAALTTKYVYNPNNGQLMRMTNKARDEKYLRNARNQVTWVEDQVSGHSVHFRYDVLGREIERRFGNGMSEHRSYDHVGRMQAIQTTDARGKWQGGEVYIYDSEGRKKFTAATDLPDKTNIRITSYFYDEQFRISKVQYAFQENQKLRDREEAIKAGLRPPLVVGLEHKYLSSAEIQEIVKPLVHFFGSPDIYLREKQAVWSVSFRYDANGNRIAKKTLWGTIEYCYDQENRLSTMGKTAYRYDANGNLIEEYSNRYEHKSFRYNQDDRMTHSAVYDFWHLQGTHSRYEYDGLGRRTLWGEVENPFNKKAVRASYEGLSFNKLGEWEVSANNFSIGSGGSGGSFGSASSSKQFFYNDTTTNNNNDILGIARSDGITTQVRYFAKDGLGSVRAELGSHVVQQRYDYDVFGTPQNLSYRQNIDSGYTGKPFDGTTGLSDYGFRDYAPQMARFTTVDPIRDGNNWYAYVNNDPVNWVDPWGLECSPSDKKSTSKSAVAAMVATVVSRAKNARSAWGLAAVVGVSIAVEVATNPAVQHEIGEAVAEVKQTVSEIGTTITSTVKGILDGIFSSKQKSEERDLERVKKEMEKRIGRHITQDEESEWHKEIDKRKTPGGKGERNPSLDLDELKEALEDALDL